MHGGGAQDKYPTVCMCVCVVACVCARAHVGVHQTVPDLPILSSLCLTGLPLSFPPAPCQDG